MFLNTFKALHSDLSPGPRNSAAECIPAKTDTPATPSLTSTWRAFRAPPHFNYSNNKIITSSLPLVQNPASLCRLCFSASKSSRDSDGSSLSVAPTSTGLGPFLSSAFSRPTWERFSVFSRLRDVHGRPGKRQRTMPKVFMPATATEAGNPPPAAAIITYHNNNYGAELSRGTRWKGAR